jgi:DNA-binding CsgD family transcriptional regulator
VTTRDEELDLLLKAAEYTLSRNVITIGDLCRAVSVHELTASRLLGQLFVWHVIGANSPPAPRRVLIPKAHVNTVLCLMEDHQGVPPRPNPLDELRTPGLTDQQRRVLDLVALGKENAEIGRAISVTYETVKTYVKNLCNLYGARNRTHLVTIAHERGLLPTAVSREDSQ